MVVCMCWDISAPGSQYSRVCKNDIPHRRCGQNGALAIRNDDSRWIRQLVAMRTLADSVVVQAQFPQSRKDIRDVIFMTEFIIEF